MFEAASLKHFILFCFFFFTNLHVSYLYDLQSRANRRHFIILHRTWSWKMRFSLLNMLIDCRDRVALANAIVFEANYKNVSFLCTAYNLDPHKVDGTDAILFESAEYYFHGSFVIFNAHSEVTIDNAAIIDILTVSRLISLLISHFTYLLAAPCRIQTFPVDGTTKHTCYSSENRIQNEIIVYS